MDRRIELVVTAIEADASRSWDTATLADLVNLSPSRFRHLFKQETGMSPAQYVKRFRMRRAEVMLRTSFLSVKEIVKQLSLGSSSHFVRDFKRIHGVTPTAYRRNFWRATRNRIRKKR